MAVKRIDSKRLFEDKITAGIIKDMDALVKKSDETTKAILKTVDALKQIKDVKSAKDLRNFTEQTKKLTDAQKQRRRNHNDQPDLEAPILRAEIEEHEPLSC